jgi:protein pelota
VRLQPEEAEDIWHLYNLLQPGDRVQAVTVRKVTSESASGERESERVRLKLTLELEAVDYDAAAAQLRLRGRNATECEAVKLGGAPREPPL